MYGHPMRHCLVALLLIVLLTSPAQHGTEARPVSCCTKTSDVKLQLKLLNRYVMQDSPLCPLKVIRFITVKDTIICSDPSSTWAIKAKLYLDRKQAQGTLLPTPAASPGEQRSNPVTNNTLLQV